MSTPTTTPWPPKRILVPVDFGEPSVTALRYAVEMARTTGAAITALHVGAPIPPIYGPLPELTGVQAEIWTDMLGQREALLKKELEALVAPLRSSTVTIEVSWAEGEPADAIGAAALDLSADLVIMGSHGRTGLRRALLGSVAERTARHCTRPVLILR